jgi:signal transduction histidine kinase
MEERAAPPASGDQPVAPSPAYDTFPGEAPHDDAGYLLVDEQWRILAATDQTSLLTEGDTSQLVGRHVRETIGSEALAALQQRGAAIFSLGVVEYMLTLTPFALSTGAVRLIRVQETQATLDRMLSLIVHEVRNPLMAMRALAQGMEETCETIPDGDRLCGYTTRLIGEIDRLNRLLASMTHIARPDARPLERLDLSVAVNRVAAIFQPDIARRGVTLNVQAPASLPPIRMAIRCFRWKIPAPVWTPLRLSVCFVPVRRILSLPPPGDNQERRESQPAPNWEAWGLAC